MPRIGGYVLSLVLALTVTVGFFCGDQQARAALNAREHHLREEEQALNKAKASGLSAPDSVSDRSGSGSTTASSGPGTICEWRARLSWQLHSASDGALTTTATVANVWRFYNVHNIPCSERYLPKPAV
jgi:hypothetical protein